MAYQGRGSALALALAAFVATSACTRQAELIIDVRTDLLPERHFDRVRTELSTELAEPGVQTSLELVDHEAREGEDFFGGTRVAHFAPLTPGPYWIRVSLADEHRATIAERLVRFDEVREVHSAIVVISSECLRVVCPGPGDAPTALSCWAGRCVEPSCIGGDPSACGPPECESEADCPEAPDCADARCVEGLCLNEPHTDRCSAEEYCDALGGCTLAACGDGSVAPTEDCDDANLRAGDGCSPTCEIEPGFSCSGAPSSCVDVLPDPIAFVDVTGAAPSVVYDSNEVSATGFDAPIEATVTGDASAVLLIGGVDSGRSATVRPGDRLALRMQASAAPATTSLATLELGGVSAPWAITTFGGACTVGMTTFTVAGPASFVVPAGCGRVSVRMWGGGGGGGRTPCLALDGGGGGATTVSRESGELLAAAGGGGGGTRLMSGGSGAYVEASFAVSEGETLALVVGTPGPRNSVDGASGGTGPFGGPVEGGGLGYGDFVVPGNAPGAITTYTAAPFNPGLNYGFGGRSDNNCTDGPVNGGRGHIELRWGP